MPAKQKEEKAESLFIRMQAVELLRLLKKEYTYEELSKIFNLPSPVLSRYIQGYVLPRLERAKEIIRLASERINLVNEIVKRINWTTNGFFDNTKVVYDVVLMKLIAEKVVPHLAKLRPNKLFTAAVDGIPFATVLATKLNVDLVYAKRSREIGVKDFLEEVITLGPSGVMLTFYLPRHALSARDRVLIVDDVMRTGETQRALLNLCKKAKAKVVGIYVLIAVGDEWKETLKDVEVPINYFVKVYPPKTEE